MKNKHRILFLLCFLTSITCVSQSTKQSPFPKDANNIVFLGNSITYDGRYVTDLETYFVTHYPNESHNFINLGLPSETVSGLSEEGHADWNFPRPCLFSRLDEMLNKVELDVVFICYGMNDGIYMPFDEERFDKYKDGINRLYQKLEEKGIKQIYMMTPPIHDDPEKGLEGYNLTLDKYSEWLIEEGKKGRWEVIDLHFPMKNYTEEKRIKDPQFKLANDGVHPSGEGHWLMAKEILLHLGENVEDKGSVEETFGEIVNADKIYKQVQKRQAHMKDACLTYVGHERPWMATGMPMEQAERLYKTIEQEIGILKTGKKRTVVSCIGNSITYGIGAEYPVLDSYPSMLQQMLGNDEYEVLNFGVSASTLLSSTDLPYVGTSEYKKFLKSEPDIVTIKLGTNDSRVPYRAQIADSMIIQAKRMIAEIKQLPTSPRIIMLLPVSSYLTDPESQYDEVLVKEVIPRLQQIAYDENIELINTHAMTAERLDIFPDRLHPNEEGMKIIANSIYQTIERENDNQFDISELIKLPYTTSSFYGYECLDFDFNGRNAKIVSPKKTAVNHPWVWRARFWGHEPQTDIALLDKGYHIVYVDASGLLGNKESVKLWNNFYNYLQDLGLYKKMALEGMSRGGVYMYNWAAENPDKVLAVYADAPVLDLKSWPGGKGKSNGSAGDWADYLKAYKLKEKNAATAKNSPIDKVGAIVRGDYPMLHVVGDADDVVPVDENTEPFEKKIKALGGNIEVIHKPGVGHHPHSLKNPQPIVDFIVKSFEEDRTKNQF